MIMHIEGFFFFEGWSSGGISLILISANMRNLTDSMGCVSSRGVWRWKEVSRVLHSRKLAGFRCCFPDQMY